MPKLISKKAFFIILVLSMVFTYAAAMVDFIFNITVGKLGIPFGFSSFNFLGGSTDYLMLFLDVVFWFVIILIIWKSLKRIIKIK